MKKQIHHIILSCCLLCAVPVFFSCSDLLDQKAYSKIEDTDIEDSDDGADLWVTGAYSGLSRMYVYDEFPRCIDLDNDYLTGPSWAFGEVGSGNFQGSTNQADPVWKLSYNLINLTNEAIYHVENMQNVTETHKANDLGELYFLQAYGYFLLVRAYGEVPIPEYSINQGEEVNKPREPIADVYAHIIDLLVQAKDMIYKNTDTGFTEGRACAGAAASLLAKVYATIASASLAEGTVYVKGGTPYYMDGDERVLTQPQTITVQKQQVTGYESFDSDTYYRLARDLAREIVTEQLYGDHELVSYNILWTKSGQNSTEHFFALQTISGDDYYGELFTREYSGQIADDVVVSGLWYGMRDHWYKLFEEEDYRITEGIMHRWRRESNLSWNGGAYYPNTDEMKLKARGLNADDEKVAEPVYPYNDGVDYRSETGENFLAYTTKYANVTDQSLTRTDAIYPFLRYADVVLILAEASNELEGPNSEALEALNAVRTRSNASEKWIGATDTGGLETKEDFRSAVLEERAMELAFEGDRRWDLIRWGIYLDVMNAIGTVDEINISKAREEKHLLYPIPQAEILANEAITENNPGWN